jgi:hypothetical protein
MAESQGVLPMESQGASRVALYSCLFGGYERLNELEPEAIGASPAILFTDDPHLTSQTWRIVVVQPAWPGDPLRSQRQIKILGHDALADFDTLVYIDNTVKLRVPIESFVEQWLQDSTLAIPGHIPPVSVSDGFDMVIAHKLDDPDRLQEQREHYAAHFPDVLNATTPWSGFFARRNNDEYRVFARIWYDHVLRYSRRDQMSIRVAMQVSGISIREIEMSNTGSLLHTWPHPTERKTHMRGSPRPDYRGQLEEAQKTMAAERRAFEVSLEHALSQLAATYEKTLSWKVTRPLRAVRSLLRRG